MLIKIILKPLSVISTANDIKIDTKREELIDRSVLKIAQRALGTM